MLDSYSKVSNNQSVKINAVSGGILKNHPKSWFERINLISDRAKQLLTEGGHKARKECYEDNGYRGYTRWENDRDNDIIILQMMICGDMEVIAECVHRSDYEQIEGEQK